MFEKLRLKLTLTNVTVILTLFLLLTVGAYYYSQIDMKRRADFLARVGLLDVPSPARLISANQYRLPHAIFRPDWPRQFPRRRGCFGSVSRRTTPTPHGWPGLWLVTQRRRSTVQSMTFPPNVSYGPAAVLPSLH